MKIMRCFAIVLLALVSSLPAQTILTHLGEFKVNSTTTGDQTNTDIATDSAGNFVVVWSGQGPGDSDGGIFFQRYTAAGSPVGPETKANVGSASKPGTAGVQNVPRIAMAGDGHFAIVWQSYEGAGAGLGFDIFLRIFDANGMPSANFTYDALVNQQSLNGHSTHPAVAMDVTGRIVVAWHFDNSPTDPLQVMIKPFDATGQPLSGEVPVAVDVSGDLFPSIAARPDGRCVVTWRGPTSNNGIFAKLYQLGNTSLTALSGAIPIAGGDAIRSQAEFRPDGGFTVVWQASANSLDAAEIFARHFNESGDPSLTMTPSDGSAFKVNAFSSGDQFLPSVAFSQNGDFVVAWTSTGEDNDATAVVFRRYFANGVADGGDRLANTFAAGAQQTAFSHTAMFDPSGNISFAWSSNGQDGDGWGVYADKFYLPNEGPSLSEFRVNTTTAGDQGQPAVAMNSSGAAVVAWTNSSGGVYFQRYNAQGQRSGLETRADTEAAGSQQHPSVAIDATGNFVVAWTAQQTGSPGEIGMDIYARRFDASGQAQGSEFSVASTRASTQGNPSVAMDANGNFVVVWDSTASGTADIRAQLFFANGIANGSEFGVNEVTAGKQAAPSVAMNAPGDFVVVWEGDDGGPSGAPLGVFKRRFNANGTPKEGESIVNSSRANYEEAPSVTLLDDGRFVVGWTTLDAVTLEGDVHFRLFAADGSSSGPDGTANAGTAGNQNEFSIAASSSGGFLGAWQSNAADGSGLAIIERRFDPTGASIEQEHVVNTFTTGDQQFTGSLRSVAVDGIGNYFIVWESAAQDGSGAGVFATRVFVATPPSANTLAATKITASTATLNGTVTPNDTAVTVSFEIANSQEELGTASSTTLPANPANLPAGVTTPQAVTRDVDGLTLGIGNSPRTYYYRTIAAPTSNTASIFGPVVSFTVQNSIPVASDDTFIITGESSLDPIKQSASAGTPGQDTDADPGDTLTIVGSAVGATLGTATTTLNHLMISYNPGDLFAGSADGDSFSYTVQDTHGAQATATIHVYSVRALAGTYAGLIGADGAGAAAGRLDITLTRMGQITGSFKWQGQLYSFNQATLGTDGTFVKALPKDRTNPDAGTLQLSLRLDALTKILTGTLTDTSTDPVTVVTAEVTGTASADDLDLQDLPGPGIYSAYIDPGTVSSAAAEIPAQLPGLTLPRGLGFSQIIVSGKSSSHSRPARTAGRMPDDQPFTSGVKGLTRALRAASGQAKYSLYVDNLYSKVRDTSDRLRSGGVVSGDLLFTRNNNRFDSSLNWERLANPNAPRFQGGIKGLTAVLNAIKYGRPPSGTLPGGIRGDHNPNTKLTFTEGDLVSTLTQAFKLTRAGGGGVQVQASGMNPQTAKLSVSATGGSFKGSFVHPGSGEVVKFNGVFKDQDGQGVFTGPTTTGRIQILAQ